MLNIVFHPSGERLSRTRLMAWCADIVAAGIAGLDNLPDSAVCLALTPPSLPWSFERHTQADDRMTLGGEMFSRLRFTARRGEWRFADIHEPEVEQWRTWYDATLGGRLPFVVGFREALYRVTAPGGFPLSMVRPGRWGGQISIQEVSV